MIAEHICALIRALAGVGAAEEPAPLFSAAFETSRPIWAIIATSVGAWRSLVAHLHGVQGVASSNLVAPTNYLRVLRFQSRYTP